MYALATIALVASAVLAQIPGLPDCSQSCITDLGGCNQVDVKCICSNVPLLTKLSCCVSKQCDANGQRDVIAFADSLCGSYGVTTLPTSAGCTGTAAPTATSSSSSRATPTMTMTGSEHMTMTSASTETGTASASRNAPHTTSTTSAATAAAAPTNAAQHVLGLGLGAAGLLAQLL